MRNYILTHKDIEPIEGYEIIDNRDNEQLDHRIWSELSGMQILYNRFIAEKNDIDMPLYSDSEYISLNHYRRRIDPDCINRFYVPQPIVFNSTLAQQYAACHNIDDLLLCGKALKEEFPQLVQPFEGTMNNRIFVPYIIGVMTIGQFKDYFNFLYKTLMNFHNKLGTQTYEDRIDYIKRYPDKYTGEGKDNKVEYQARIESFLAERLATTYFGLCSQKTQVFPAAIIKDEGVF
jgi:hypothetical protein